MSDQIPPPNSPEPPSRSGGGAGAGDAAAPKEIILARWVDRFIAWIIDFVIVNAAVWIVVGLALASPFMLGTDQRMVIDREDGRHSSSTEEDPWVTGGGLEVFFLVHCHF